MTETAVKETRGFETEVKQLLQLMVHSLYSNKEIFLRELVSNASDAADKLRFEAIEHPDWYEDSPQLGIWIDYNKDDKTLTIKDNGIGMSREEVIQNLGTIARSGTKEFLSRLSGEQAKDSQLIGQFGVGFYSSFMVADEVTVYTRRAGAEANAGICWKSKGDGEYTLESIDRPARGTEIVLHLKSEDDDLLSTIRLKHLITQYSDHIGLPIHVKKEEGSEFEVANQATALWTLPKSEITEDQYKSFYQHVAHDFEDPLDWSHNRVEGKLEYTTLLYIPSRPQFDLWDPRHTRGLKLYVRRVFIMEDAEQLLPRYLRFVRGVVDSQDLPLNVSREILQSSRVVDTIKQGVVKRVLSMLETMSSEQPEKYQTFWQHFGAVLKEGPGEDFANKERIAKLLRFSSTHSSDATPTVSLEQYLKRMKETQQKIYYSVADSYEAAKNSPHLEVFLKNGIEVLLLTDRVDEWLLSHLTEFEGKALQSVARGQLDESELSKDTESADKNERRQALQKDFEDILSRMKTTLGDAVKDVRLSERLTQSPACIVADEHDLSPHMERILRAAGQEVHAKPILELNPDHALIKQLKTQTDNQAFEDLSHLLLEQSIIAEGGQLKDPGSFVKRLNRWLVQ